MAEIADQNIPSQHFDYRAFIFGLRRLEGKTCLGLRPAAILFQDYGQGFAIVFGECSRIDNPFSIVHFQISSVVFPL